MARAVGTGSRIDESSGRASLSKTTVVTRVDAMISAACSASTTRVSSAALVGVYASP
ncbi:MAG TPA: hypothetical protein VMV92_45605 [Streptosporangiaceae bacterium]|nr:hypothetical protein [Streptosporangiaceae bacterium]